MKIKILNRFGKPSPKAKSTIFLIWDNWNDFSYYTLFGIYYADSLFELYELGAIKIGYFGQEEGSSKRKLSIGDELDELDDTYFSLGQSDMYYSILNKLGTKERNSILNALKDIALNEDLYDRAIKESVTRISLFRTVSPATVKSQFRRLLSGGVHLTDYNFNFFAPKIRRDSSSFDLSFKVIPESFPPTNIHVLIGRNGVGKTYLTNNMINSLLEGKQNENGFFEFIENEEDENEFANLISISFSAFDDAEPRPEKKDKTKGIQYSYIGLKQVQPINDKPLGTKSTTKLKNEFFRSLDFCRSSKKVRWSKGIEMLESDPNFKDADIKFLIDIEDDDDFKSQAYSIFNRLSSGHKIVLLTITRLIETLQEKSLVLIDEPEAHLHPPLLSAFVRALSELLITTNGVAIIATHSPVILQEVPKSCAWKLRRIGAEAIAERLKTETFGENVGILTNEVFGLEVTNSGFYKLLNKVAEENDSYDDALNYFDGQLGMEARAILMTYYAIND
jgi:ABC-type multidrug transport system ATPase subunit